MPRHVVGFPLNACDASNRPSIRSGIGGLTINVSLVFYKAAMGDLDGSLERISRCVEVFERFPGVCRVTMCTHAAHVMITALATMDRCKARKLYHTLRTSYNSARLPGTASLPPLEEWQGISPCCGYFYCRTMERLLLSKEMGVSSNRTLSGIQYDGINGETNEPFEPFDGGGQMTGLGSTSMATDASNTPTAPFASRRDRTGLRPANCCDASPHIHAGAEWAEATPIAARTFPFTPNGPNGEAQTLSNADTGGAERVENGRTVGADQVSQAPAELLVDPCGIQWGGTEDGTGSECGLDAADWQEAAEALLNAVSLHSIESAEQSYLP